MKDFSYCKRSMKKRLQKYRKGFEQTKLLRRKNGWKKENNLWIIYKSLLL